MRLLLIAAVTGLLMLPAARSFAEPGGCLKYGTIGAVAGFTVGHGAKGAAAGCVTGMIVRQQARKAAAAKMPPGGLVTAGRHGVMTPR